MVDPSSSPGQRGHVGLWQATLVVLVFGLSFGFGIPANQLPEGLEPPWGRVSAILGWGYVFAWGVFAYPQIYLNHRRRSTAGYSFDYLIYNLFGFICYTTFNSAFYFSSTVRAAYREAHGGEDSAVRINDVAFPLHSIFTICILLGQAFFFNPTTSRPSVTCAVICSVVAAGIAAMVGATYVGAAGATLLRLLYLLSYVKIGATLIKYIPQVMLNYRRKSTFGLNPSNLILDFTGGTLSVSQQVLEAVVLGELHILTGDLAKLGLGLISMTYDVIMMFQHYILYAVPQDEDPEDYKPLPSADLEESLLEEALLQGSGQNGTHAPFDQPEGSRRFGTGNGAESAV